MEFLKNWPQICFAFLCLLFVTWYLKHKSQAIDYWPFLGTLPSLLRNSNRIPEWFTEVFESLGGRGSFFIGGPIFSKLKYLVTCDPQNIEYILKTNFSNFIKGPAFNEIFDLLGDGIFNVNDELWQSQRRRAHACLSSVEFRNLVAKSSKKVVSDSLVPFLAHAARQGCTIDLQDMCNRLTFDMNMSTTFGRDEGHLSIDLPANELAAALHDAQEPIIYRHIMPMFLWKFFRWLVVGKERRLSKACRTIDVLLSKYISAKRECLHKGVETNDILATYIKSLDSSKNDTKFLRDTMLGFILASGGTIASGLTWFLWLVAKTPRVEAKILEELKFVVSKKRNDTESSDTKWQPWVFDADDLKRLVYLHVALCESLRLYPSVPLNIKTAIKEDVLPDGTIIKPGMKIILSFFSEGKMPWIWGEDSLEFKPERWIDDEGKLSNKPMSKFFTFNIGPRTCLGKDITFTRMKCAVAAILFNFHVELVKGQRIVPKPAISLQMKNGLMVKIRERAM